MNTPTRRKGIPTAPADMGTQVQLTKLQLLSLLVQLLKWIDFDAMSSRVSMRCLIYVADKRDLDITFCPTIKRLHCRQPSLVWPANALLSLFICLNYLKISLPLLHTISTSSLLVPFQKFTCHHVSYCPVHCLSPNSTLRLWRLLRSFNLRLPAGPGCARGLLPM